MARAELVGIGLGSWLDMALDPTRGSMGDDLVLDRDILAGGWWLVCLSKSVVGCVTIVNVKCF
jgi:hypothetical protein